MSPTGAQRALMLEPGLSQPEKLVLVGQGNKLELWSESLWLAEREQALQDSLAGEELPDELMSLTL